MRLLAAVLASALLASAQSPREKEVIAVLQRTFDALAAHDAAAIASIMLPDARIYSLRDAAAPSSTGRDELIARLAMDKTPLHERFTRQPRVLIHGRLAQIWGDYEFHRDGKFSHCGVDTASLFKTESGWKIATLVYTVETTGCKSH